jgi:hypothetical protein
LVRVAAAVEAGDYMHRPVDDPKEQRVRKSPAPSTPDVSVNNGRLCVVVAILSTIAATSAVKRLASSSPSAL